MVPLVGFLDPADRRVANTVDAIQRELTHDGFVYRYDTERDVDGLPGGEGVFLLCTFWLVDDLHLLGRAKEATALYERLLGLRNDVGLLSEQCDPTSGRLLGNFPQAFSHVALVDSAMNLHDPAAGPARRRSGIAD
jgi:GH15 family glucan-1,4-alpha-glucosidase